MDEYLERLFADAYKREVEQEETVIRSLPFMAAAAAIIVAVIRELSSDLPPWAWELKALILHGLLVLTVAAFAWTGWFVFQALRRRPFRYPRGEQEILETARRLIAYHKRAGLAAEDAEQTAVADLRREMIDQYAVCAENNRQQNEARQAARTFAFHGLMAAFLFVVLLVALLIQREQSMERRPMATRTPAKSGRDRSTGTAQSSKVPAKAAAIKTVAGSALSTKPHLQAPRRVIKGAWGRVPSMTQEAEWRDRKP